VSASARSQTAAPLADGQASYRDGVL
jgi:hypothetical protein